MYRPVLHERRSNHGRAAWAPRDPSSGGLESNEADANRHRGL